MLERKIHVMKRVHTAGSLTFDYMASRDLGPVITETVAFHFEFFPKGNYCLQFSHDVQGDLADVGVDMYGSWHVEMGDFVCETSEAPVVCGNKPCSSPAVVRFNLPIELVLAGRVAADHDGSCALRWENSIQSRSLLLDFPHKSESKLLDVMPPPENDEDASYVEVDGRMVQVCGDIRDNYPESSWAHLMSVRVKVGLV
jgi:hypothetical protein